VIACGNRNGLHRILLKHYGIGEGAKYLFPPLLDIDFGSASTFSGGYPVFVDIRGGGGGGGLLQHIDRAGSKRTLTTKTNSHHSPSISTDHPGRMPAILAFAAKHVS